MTVGIHAYGAYVPRMRLSRSTIVDAHSWYNPGLKSLAKGERAICNWDEDSVTMAVEATRQCLPADQRDGIDALYFASTTAPFQDRQNAGLIASALALDQKLLTLDLGGSQRAGTSALATALHVAHSGQRVVVSAGEKRRTKAASPLELTTGDAGAAFLVGHGDGLARLLASSSDAVDFVDHYRGQDEAFDYVWEERWIRDEGHFKLVPGVLQRALGQANIDAAKVSHFCYPAPSARVTAQIAKRAGISESAVRDNLQSVCGEAGSAHPLLMLAHALDDANPGDIVVVAGFGQGVDIMVFVVTDHITQHAQLRSASQQLKDGRSESNYHRYLAINDLVTMEKGLRAEVDKQTGLTTLYRNKDMLMSLQGGRCSECGTLQFPMTNVCVSPNCQALGTQEPYSFADSVAQLRSFTADRLTYSPAPPAYYGMVQFAEGARTMIDFTDIDPTHSFEVGEPMRMMFRIKDVDPKRGFRRYFWKATPVDTRQGD